jgi:hypothetical protein
MKNREQADIDMLAPAEHLLTMEGSGVGYRHRPGLAISSAEVFGKVDGPNQRFMGEGKL